MKVVKCTVGTLLFLGGLNLGWIGLTGNNLVTQLFGTCCPALDKGIHIAIGLASITLCVGIIKQKMQGGEDKK